MLKNVDFTIKNQAHLLILELRGSQASFEVPSFEVPYLELVLQNDYLGGALPGWRGVWGQSHCLELWKLELWKLELWKLELWRLELWRLELWKLELWSSFSWWI